MNSTDIFSEFGKNVASEENESPSSVSTEVSLGGNSYQALGENLNEISKVFSTQEVKIDEFKATEIQDSAGLYSALYDKTIIALNKPIVSADELKLPCKVKSEILHMFTVAEQDYYYKEANLKECPYNEIEDTLKQGKTYELVIFDGSSFSMTPIQSSLIMRRYKQFRPVIKENEGTYVLIVGEIA